jgi:hypothetical protein
MFGAAVEIDGAVAKTFGKTGEPEAVADNEKTL